MNDGLTTLPRLVIFYVKYIDSNDTAAFISNVSRFYTIGTLERLTSSDHVEVRRSAALALGFLGDQECDAAFLRLLHDDDRTVRVIAENGLRSIWARAGSDANRQMLRTVMRLILAKQYEDAVVKATELIKHAPKFAEAWNQRAVAHFALKQYGMAIDDGIRALKFNHHHFAAAIGVGHAHLFLGNISQTIEFFRLALDINPNLVFVRENLSKLVQNLKEE